MQKLRLNDSAERKKFTAENVVLAGILLQLYNVAQQIKLFSYY